MPELFQYAFVQNAFLAGAVVAIVAACVGYLVVLRGQTFAVDSISHVGFTGATAAALLGIDSLVGVFLFTLLAAAGMAALGKRLRGRDVEIGMILSFVLGLGVLFISLYTQHAAAAVNLLFGSILSVSSQDLWIIFGVSLLSLGLMAIIFRPLLFASVDPEVAEARGLPIQAINLVFLLIQAVTISIAIPVVGVLLVFALLVVPAAAAERLFHSPAASLAGAIAFSLASTWGGLALAFVAHGPASFYIVSLATLFYAVARLVGYLRTPQRYQAEPHPGREVFSDATQKE